MLSHIVILVHRQMAFENSSYFLSQIAKIWQDQGIRVSVQRDAGARLAADLAILHVDVTAVPQDYLELARQYPLVLNGRIVDNSKRVISTNLVSRRNGYRGPVIVKTNENHGGLVEAQLAKTGSKMQRYAHALRSRFPWSFRSEMPVGEYRIFDSILSVPAAVWFNPNLVVEKFLPERRDGFYCLRTWVFLGDKETNSLSYSREPVVKSNNVVRREAVPDVPEELRRMKEKLGFDFGKFDYAIVDGNVVLYDANRTPTLGNLPPPKFLPTVRLLADGLRVFR